ncbi:5-hydroxyisourate hydrolase-like isoform X2 [Mercenaria mercenaria]|uniref:5-hydroxyisourate hydrolase-like isoform X2 n=1 Tax=Mercenaria mercenaria TaxID=6596 RepID=UPI00234F11BA|nr:5-hydroxyisourate hydrolase-like isoform X2 [Mercenaria mercenaria]
MSSSDDRLRVTVGHLYTARNQLTMASAVPPLTTHILDTATGVPAANVPMVLSRQKSDGQFDELERGSTNNDGRGGFLKGGNWQPGVYKLYFNTDAYFKQQNTTGFYPYVEVVFRIVDPNQHYHVPLLLAPYGYSTYRGS